MGWRLTSRERTEEARVRQPLGRRRGRRRCPAAAGGGCRRAVEEAATAAAAAARVMVMRVGEAFDEDQVHDRLCSYGGVVAG